MLNGCDVCMALNGVGYPVFHGNYSRGGMGLEKPFPQIGIGFDRIKGYYIVTAYCENDYEGLHAVIAGIEDALEAAGIEYQECFYHNGGLRTFTWEIEAYQ